MARLDFEDFADKEISELVRVYIAGELKEAKLAESILTEHGIDYAVDIEPYGKYVLGVFPSIYAGAGFFVPPGQAAFARSTLLAAGLKAGIEGDGVKSPRSVRH